MVYIVKNIVACFKVIKNRTFKDLDSTSQFCKLNKLKRLWLEFIDKLSRQLNTIWLGEAEQ